MITQQELRPVTQTGNTFIDALLFETAFDPFTVITYVLQGNPGDTDPYGGALWATDDRDVAFALALASWANVANISFVQSDLAYDGTGSTAGFDWIESLDSLGQGILGQHNLPFPGVMEGTFNLDEGVFEGTAIFPGGLGFATLVHEIGHGVGLLHPHEEGVSSGWDFAFPGVTDPFDTGTFGLNQGPFTVMTYNSGYAEVGIPISDSIGWEAGPGAFDIAAVQHLYGANTSYNTGNNTYNLPDQNVAGTGWQAIWDAGGTDTLSAAGTSLGAYIDLRAATLLLEPGGGGFVSRVDGILGGYTIANGVVIENAIGGTGEDVFVGNSANNTISGGAGFDIIDFSHMTTGVTVNLQAGTATGDGTDTLSFIEGVYGGSGNDVLTARDQTSTALPTDVIIRDGNFTGGQSLANPISLNGMFDFPINATGGAPTGPGTGLASVEAVGRGGIDYYAVRLGPDAQGGQLIIDIDATFDLDSIVQLLDSQGNVLATNDDIGLQIDPGSASPFDSYLTFNLPASIFPTQTYIIAVGSYSSGGISAIGSNSSYTMHVLQPFGNAGVFAGYNGLLDGGEGNDTLTGGAGVDHLIGGTGDDTLRSSAGADLLEGGQGNDSYYILNSAGLNNVIVELVDGGNDQIIASVNYTLSAVYIEEVSLAAGSAATTLSGNGLGNILRGNELGNTINGLEGDDHIYGGLGNDSLIGGAGNDTFYVEGNNDLAFENVAGGTDRVVSSDSFYLYANIENLTLTGSADLFGVGNELVNDLTGNAGANLLIAGLGNDTVRGFDGNDLLFGEGGDDTLFGYNGIDYLVGGIGNDLLIGMMGADAIYGEDGDDILSGDSQQTTLSPFGGASIPSWYGTSFDTDILVGGAGNDTLYGNSGLGDYDLMYGNTGNDIFYVDTPDDLVFEEAGEGNDTVYAGIIGAGYYLYDNIETLILTGQTPFGVGNASNNTMIGNSIGNYLLGGAGNDTLNGMAGGDVLFGEAGDDTFIFEGGTGGDVIGDFTSGDDQIDLQDFNFASFAALQTLFIQNGNVGAINLGNGDLVVLHSVTMANLTADDFIL